MAPEDLVSVKMERALLNDMKVVCARRGLKLSEYISQLIRGPLAADYRALALEMGERVGVVNGGPDGGPSASSSATASASAAAGPAAGSNPDGAGGVVPGAGHRGRGRGRRIPSVSEIAARDAEVLRLRDCGMTCREVAAQLNIGLATVNEATRRAQRAAAPRPVPVGDRVWPDEE